MVRCPPPPPGTPPTWGRPSAKNRFNAWMDCSPSGEPAAQQSKGGRAGLRCPLWGDFYQKEQVLSHLAQTRHSPAHLGPKTSKPCIRHFSSTGPVGGLHPPYRCVSPHQSQRPLSSGDRQSPQYKAVWGAVSGIENQRGFFFEGGTTSYIRIQSDYDDFHALYREGCPLLYNPILSL